jgi:hypothetical protein
MHDHDPTMFLRSVHLPCHGPYRREEKNREREKPAGCMVLESDRAAARKALESDEWNSRIATV